MTTTFSQTSSNDIEIGSDGQLKIASGRDAYAAIVADTVRTLIGECPMNSEKGIDYFNTVFKSVTKLNIWKHYVTEAVTALDFVKSIVSFDADYQISGRKMSYTLTVETDDGSLTVSN